MLDIEKPAKPAAIPLLIPKSNQKPDQLLLKFFKPNIPQNAPLVSQPSPIHAPDIWSRQLLMPKNNLKVQVAASLKHFSLQM
jgi:hypothetical protein